MLLMTTRTGKDTIAAALAHQEYFGLFVTPLSGQTAFDLFDCWCADNGAFSYTMRGIPFDEQAFWRMLARLMPHRATCRFVVVPDVPFQWKATLEKYTRWNRTVLNLGFPRALAVQDGATIHNIPWDDCEAIFIGGSTRWKREQYNDLPMFRHFLTPRDEIIMEAKARGKWVHVGRQANSWKQFQQAKFWGVDSVDGSGEKVLQKWKQMAGWIWEVNKPPSRLQ